MRALPKQVWASLGAAGVALTIVGAPRDAQACGGCFTPPTPVESESVITDEKMVLSISMTQTTLYDQINYSGSPSSFAWVLPIKGTVTVGLSADIMFQVINQLTATEVQAPPANCPPPPTCPGRAMAGGAASTASSTSGGVTVTAQQQVGPYEAVQLHSTDGSALNDWLTQHGYEIPASTKPVIKAYVKEHFDFLALKLIPGQGVQSMQPVRVTSQGAAPSLPLHMVAVGTGATTGITIWVVASGRWAPSNFPTFTIADSEISWDWATSSSNYETLRLSKEATYKGRGWQIESSLDLSQYTLSQTLISSVQYIQQGGYSRLPVTPPLDAGADAAQGDASSAPDDAGDAGDDQTAAATADLAVLFEGIPGSNARITRMRSDVAKSALSVDMVLEASTDQSELSNIYVAQQQVGQPSCPSYGGCGGGESGSSTGEPSGASESGATASTRGDGAGGATSGTTPGAGADAIAGGTPAGGSGCSTTSSNGNTGPTLAVVLGLSALVGARLRRKRHTKRAD